MEVTRRALAAYFFGVLALCVGASSTARAWCQSCTETHADFFPCQPDPCVCLLDEGELHIAWQQRCISYSLHRVGSADIPRPDLERIVAESFSTWADVSCGASTVGFEVQQTEEDAQGSVAEFAPEGGNVNLVAFIRDWDEYDYLPSAYAVTTTWFGVSSGRIIDADIHLNEEYWTWAECSELGCTQRGTVDLQNTLAHEVGHFFGLAHSDDSSQEATMYECANDGDVNKRDLAPDDIEGICSIYPEGSLDEECAFEPVGGFNPTPIALRPDCGCHIHSDNGPNSVYALTLFALVCWRRRRR